MHKGTFMEKRRSCPILFTGIEAGGGAARMGIRMRLPEAGVEK